MTAEQLSCTRACLASWSSRSASSSSSSACGLTDIARHTAWPPNHGRGQWCTSGAPGYAPSGICWMPLVGDGAKHWDPIRRRHNAKGRHAECNRRRSRDGHRESSQCCVHHDELRSDGEPQLLSRWSDSRRVVRSGCGAYRWQNSAVESESASRSDVRVDGRADERVRAELLETNPVARRTQEFFRQSAWTWPPGVLQPRSDRSVRANILLADLRRLGRSEETGEPPLSQQDSSSDSQRCVRPMAERFQLAGGTNWCQPQRRGLAEGRFLR
jgi:hypothetical protein